MQKRTAGIFLIYISYAILLLHNLVPHHHHDPHHNPTGNIPASHHGDCDDSGNNLRHLFAHLSHAEDGFTFISLKNTGTDTFEVNPVNPALPVHISSMTELEVPENILKPPPEKFPARSFLNGSIVLRGPPVLFV